MTAAVAAAAEASVPRESNSAFAAKVGCNHTMASRLRSGQRMPSPTMLLKICKAYDLDHGEALRKYGEGREPFSAWLREKVPGLEPG